MGNPVNMTACPSFTPSEPRIPIAGSAAPLIFSTARSGRIDRHLFCLAELNLVTVRRGDEESEHLESRGVEHARQNVGVGDDMSVPSPTANAVPRNSNGGVRVRSNVPTATIDPPDALDRGRYLLSCRGARQRLSENASANPRTISRSHQRVACNVPTLVRRMEETTPASRCADHRDAGHSRTSVTPGAHTPAFPDRGNALVPVDYRLAGVVSRGRENDASPCSKREASAGTRDLRAHCLRYCRVTSP